MRVFLVWLVAALIAAAGSANAQSYPARPITLIVPFAAGGPTDVLARIVAERMRASLGQTVVVENVTGAAGTIGVGRVVRAEPDGYTIGIGQWGSHVLNGAIYQLPYDLLNDLVPIAQLATNPQVIVSKNAVPASTLPELITWIKQNAAKASQGTAGIGSVSHVSGIYFQQKIGAAYQFVPYRGAGPAMQDLIAGHTDLMIDQSSNALPNIKSGLIRAYAVTSKTRLSSAPDIPTVDEAGLPEFYVSVWHALWAPKGTPAEVVKVLNAAVVDTLADPAIQKRLTELGQEFPPRDAQTAEALAAFHKAEIAKWWPIIKAANLSAPK